jgi:hypothetical protein
MKASNCAQCPTIPIAHQTPPIHLAPVVHLAGPPQQTEVYHQTSPAAAQSTNRTSMGRELLLALPRTVWELLLLSVEV